MLDSPGDDLPGLAPRHFGVNACRPEPTRLAQIRPEALVNGRFGPLAIGILVYTDLARLVLW